MIIVETEKEEGHNKVVNEVVKRLVSRTKEVDLIFFIFSFSFYFIF